MRLWSLHPKYLDTKGLVALWREALLAKKVLEGKTNGYKNHPQLERFRKKPLIINSYLEEIWKESVKRGYNFNKKLIGRKQKGKINVTTGQIKHEKNHLKKKLEKRKSKIKIGGDVNPIFFVIKGSVKSWEKVYDHPK